MLNRLQWLSLLPAFSHSHSRRKRVAIGWWGACPASVWSCPTVYLTSRSIAKNNLIWKKYSLIFPIRLVAATDWKILNLKKLRFHLSRFSSGKPVAVGIICPNVIKITNYKTLLKSTHQRYSICVLCAYIVTTSRTAKIKKRDPGSVRPSLGQLLDPLAFIWANKKNSMSQAFTWPNKKNWREKRRPFKWLSMAVAAPSFLSCLSFPT